MAMRITRSNVNGRRVDSIMLEDIEFTSQTYKKLMKATSLLLKKLEPRAKVYFRSKPAV